MIVRDGRLGEIVVVTNKYVRSDDVAEIVGMIDYGSRIDLVGTIGIHSNLVMAAKKLGVPILADNEKLKLLLLSIDPVR